MVDLVFGVDDAEEWHAQNLQQNPGHYSSLRVLGAGPIAGVQRWGARVYYNTLVPTTLDNEAVTIKYGVISHADLLSELHHWDSMYIAGRLHKPVALLRHSPVTLAAVEANRMTALKVVLAMHSSRAAVGGDTAAPATLSLSPTELYMAISRLSYMGDPRMGIAENKNKVANIVTANLAHFEQVYAPLLDSLGVANADGNYVWSWDAASLERLLLEAPSTLWEQGVPQGVDIAAGSAEQLVAAAVRGNAVDPVLSHSIASIVKRTATAQTAKGLLTAGLLKSARYVGAKVRKGYESK